MKVKIGLQWKLSLLFIANIILVLLFVNFFTKSAINFQFRQFCEHADNEVPSCLYSQISQRFLSSIDFSLIVVSVVGLLMAIFLGFVFSRSFLKPIHTIIKSAKKASAGDYKTKIATVTHDETDLLIEALNKMYQNLQEIETLRKELVANLSHELSTPLTNIYGYLSALSDKMISTKKERESTIEHTKEEVERLIHLIKELKKLAVIDSQSANLSLSKTDLNNLIKKVCSSFQSEISKKEIRLILNLNKEIPEIMIDINQIKQVLINLLDNAIKFSKKGGKITISTKIMNNNLNIIFSDNGLGIKDKDLPFIFERFYQANKSLSNKEGIGIGLAIARRIIEAHQGKITVSSTHQKGAQFSVLLPISSR